MKFLKKYWLWIVAALALAIIVYGVITVRDYRPPSEFSMATGREGGAYHMFGQEYQRLLAEQGYTLNLVMSAGSVENLELLEAAKADVALVQAGTASAQQMEILSSLGSLFYEPLWIFYHLEPGNEPDRRISDFAGRDIAVGEIGGGTYSVARFILAENGVTEENATLHALPNNEAVGALTSGEVDVMFVVASPEAGFIPELVQTPGIELMSIERHLAYQSRYDDITTITLGEGTISLAENIPGEDKVLLATVAALVAPHDLSPDLARILLDVAAEVHGPGGILEYRGEFPSTKLVELPMDVVAQSYLERGPTGLDRFFPLWMASRLERILILLIPFLVLLYPLFRTTPLAVSFFFRIRINRWYRRLRTIEVRMNDMTVKELDAQIAWLDDLVQDLAKRLAVPMVYLADVYLLRFQVNQVNQRLERRKRQILDGLVAPGQPTLEPEHAEDNEGNSPAPFELDEDGNLVLASSEDENGKSVDSGTKERTDTELSA